jgi:hypothetical protein
MMFDHVSRFSALLMLNFHFQYNRHNNLNSTMWYRKCAILLVQNCSVEGDPTHNIEYPTKGPVYGLATLAPQNCIKETSEIGT